MGVDPGGELLDGHVAGHDGVDRVIVVGLVQRTPLRRRNTTIVVNAVRLLPSGSASFLARCQHSTAAFSHRVG